MYISVTVFIHSDQSCRLETIDSQKLGLATKTTN